MSLVEKIYAKLKNAPLLGSVCIDLGADKIAVCADGTPLADSTQAECTLSLSSDTLVGLGNGTVDAMAAYFAGDIKITGDIGVAISLAKLLKA